MKKQGKAFLVAGMTFVSLGLFLLAAFWDALAFKPLLLRSVLISIFGAFLLASTLSHKKPRTIAVFFAIMLEFAALALFLIDAEAIRFSKAKVLPILCCSSGIALLITGHIVSRKFKKNIVVPSLSIFAFGAFLSLFSFNVIKITFAHFVSSFWPLIFVFAGLCLIALFASQRRAFFSEDSEKE